MKEKRGGRALRFLSLVVPGIGKTSGPETWRWTVGVWRVRVRAAGRALVAAVAVC